MSDLHEVVITHEVTMIVDADRFFLEYPEEWAEAEADGCDREEFIRETIYELTADDLATFAVEHPKHGWISQDEISDTYFRRLPA